MDWNRFFASLFVLSLAPVAVTAQTPALDSGASAHVDFTIAQKQTVYQSISEIIAERIVAAASNGERDPVRLREAAIPWLTHERD